MLEIRVVHHMVLRELGGFAVAHQIAARVAHMGQRVRVAAQHQRSQRGQAHRRVAASVDAAQPGILCANDAVQGHRGVPGLGRAKVVSHQARDRRLRRLATHAASAYAIGNGDDRAPIFLPRQGQHGGAKVFVLRLAPSQRRIADIYIKSHGAQPTSICMLDS